MENIYFKNYCRWISRFFRITAFGLVAMLLSSNAFAQDGQVVKGKVTGLVDNSPIPGVSILIKGSTTGTTTDANGDFSIQAKPSDVIVFSFIGYLNEEIVVGNRTQIDVSLSESMEQLSEVVVIGYGVQEKKLVTGATVQVKGDDIQKLSTVSPIAALQSQVPGVNITKTSGEPGAGFKILIRGAGTTGNSAPLYVVDGVIRGDISYLNPADIQSVDVLKDAASAAIYGSRAANGVVLVTTKRGKKGQKMSVTYNGYYGAQNVYKRLPLLTAKEYMVIQNEGQVNSGLKPIDWESQLAPGDYERIQNGTWNGTNWLKEIENKNAPLQSHALTLAGGSESSIFSAGLSYTSQEGIYGKPVQSVYDRYTFRINSEHTIIKSNSKEFDILKIGQNLTYSYTNNHGIGTGNMWWNDIYNTIQSDPLLPMYATDAADPAYPYHSPIPWNSLASNPVGSMVYGRGSNENKSHALNANFYAELQPLKGLTLRSAFSVSPGFNSYRGWTPTYNLGPNNKNTANGVSQSMSGGLGGWLNTNTLNYKFSLMNDHHLDVLVGQSAERWGLGESLSTSNKNSLFNDFEHAWISNANVNTTATISGAPWQKGGMLSFFGRVNYDYKDTYLLSLIMRRDGSSNLAQGHNWDNFPSVSAGWVLTNERFFESIKSVVDFLKIRGSWGLNGNQSVAPNQDQALITFNNPGSNVFANYYFGSSKITPSLGAFPNNIPNKNLKWETTEQLDIGLDATFLNSKVTLSFDYYKKTTHDWIVAAPILASWGVQNAPSINGGEIENKGVEIALGYNDNIGSDFRFSVNGNISFNHNQVMRLDNSQGIINAVGVKLWGNGTYVARAEVGHPIGYFYGYKTAGIFQNVAEIQNYKDAEGNVIQPNAVPGDVKFVDTDGVGGITEFDQVSIGNPNPKYTFGLNLTAAYKGFDLSVNSYGVGGNQIARNWHDAGSARNNYTTEILGRWHGEGTSNTIPRVTSGSSINQTFNSDLSIENGSYYRLSNLTLGYNFKTLLPSMPLNQFRLFVTAQNLFTVTKYSGMDPEIGTSTDDGNYGWSKGVDLGFYPNPRTFMVGATLQF
ncbi:MAG: TonB-dependent receptor [Chryseolinea sp.]